MVENLKNKTIAETFRKKLKTPWVWLVVLLTILLTILFSISQKPEMVVYSQYIKSLSDFQLLDSRLSKDMEKVRIGFGVDSMSIISEAMTLREMAVSFARQMDNLQGFGIKQPKYEMIGGFEREVLGKVAVIKRYLEMRQKWHKDYGQVSYLVSSLNSSEEQVIREILDSAKAGYLVSRPSLLELSDTLKQEIDRLLIRNNEMAEAWKRFDNDNAILYCEEMIQFFQMERLNEMALNAKIPMVFYFLTLVLLLTTFFFMFRSKD